MFLDLENALECSEDIAIFKQSVGLDSGYELHHSANPKWLRNAFMKVISRLDFTFSYFAISKNTVKDHQTYQKLSSSILDYTKDSFKSIRMDVNPSLYKELKKQFRNKGFKINLKQTVSRGNNLIQLADYVAASTLRALKQDKQLDFRRKCVFFKIIK